jgi:hypothetical protein
MAWLRVPAVMIVLGPAGMRHVTYTNIMMGVVAVHSGFKE